VSPSNKKSQFRIALNGIHGEDIKPRRLTTNGYDYPIRVKKIGLDGSSPSINSGQNAIKGFSKDIYIHGRLAERFKAAMTGLVIV
jgi:hypothetical protein